MPRIYRRLTPFLPILLFAAILFTIFLPVFAASAGYTLFGDDLFRSYGFFREFFRDSIRQGIVPWWNPYLFSGTPFLANPSVSFLYPLNVLYVLLPVGSAWPLTVFLSMFLSMAGMYWLGRVVMGWSRSAAMGMAVAYGLSGPVVARIWAGHSEILASIPFIPWVFGLYAETVRKEGLRYLIATGLVFGMQVVAGYQTVAMFTGELLAVTAVVFAISNRSLRPLRVLFAIVGIAAGSAAVQLVPNLEYFRYSIRTYAFGYDWASYGSVQWQNFKELIAPFALGDTLTYHGTPPNYPEQAMYTGVATVVLAAVGVVGLFFVRTAKRKFTAGVVVSVVLTALLAAWVSLGPNAPVNLHRLLWQVIPLYRNLRIPPRHLILVSFGLSVVAGLGIEILKKHVVRAVVVSIIVLEMVLFARQFIEVRPVPGTEHDQGLISAVSGDSQPYRLLQNFGVWVPPRDALDFDAVMQYRIFSVTGYDPSILRNYFDFADAAIGSTTPSVREHDVQIPYLNVFSPYVNFLNVKYILVPSGYDPMGGGTSSIFPLIRSDDVQGYRLYENPAAFPRFFLVPSMAVLPSRDAVAAEIRNGTADLSNQVLTTGISADTLKHQQPDCSMSPLPPVRVVSYGVNDITLSTDVQCNAYLSSSEVMYPGWTAYVDGKKTDIIEGNLAFRALYIPAGKHTVTFRFVPVTFYAGLAVTVATLVFAGYSFFRRQRG